MANRRFPSNNNRNNTRNNNRRNNNIQLNCPQCSQKIQILNDDVQFSLNLHMQSHKSLESIDQDIDRQLSRARFGPNVQMNVQSNYVCPECNESVQIFDNDIKRSLELHAQKHQRFSVGTRGDDQSSECSNKSRNSSRSQNCNVKNQSHTKSEARDVLNDVFYKLPPGLKAHRGFVFENKSEFIICRVCNFKIESLSKIADHLVTKSHEDNAISFIKSELPYELHETMDFVSFYGSNLCCNLCRCKIDLSSLNISETILNIITHNAGQQHANKRSRDQPADGFKDGMKKINFLASKDSVINNNKHMISCVMQPQFKCQLCDKLILYDQNDHMLLKNFTSHFSSNGHSKCVRATSVLNTLKSTRQLKGGKHNLIVTKGSITCTVCKISMDPSLDTLEAHIKEVDKKVDSFPGIDWPEDLSARINKMDFKGPQEAFKGQNNKTEDNKLSKLNDLLRIMPLPYRNIDYVVESSQGQVTCLICSCAIPSTFYNLKSHLTGSNHLKNLSGTKGEFVEARPPNDNVTTTPAKSQNFNPFIKENSSPTINATSKTGKNSGDVPDFLKKSEPVIRKNLSLLTKHDDNVYSCKLCKITIPKSHNAESLKQNLISHFSQANHKRLFADKQDSEVNKLLTVDPLVRANKKYLCKLEDSILCTLCDSELSISIDVIKLKQNLTEHLKGQQHLNKVKEITTIQDATKPLVFLSKSTGNLKTQNQISKTNEFPNSATKSSIVFQNPVDQFKGPQNFSKPDEPKNSLQNPSFFLPKPTESLREQSINAKSKEPNLEPPKPIFLSSASTDLITELFRKLPVDFQSDIAFIKKSSDVEGFLACTICNMNHINPPYLQKHLEEEKHLQSKILRQPLSFQRDSPVSSENSASSKKMMQNMKNFFGFSN